ncbi:MAG: envelope biogenesis factor ElyC, partial [Candidatus Hodarchaeota archaeon]
MFIFKKIASQFLYPLPLSLEISFLGLALLWFTRKQRAGRLLVSFGLLTLTLLSYGAISDQLLDHLENKYKPYNVNNLNQDSNYRIQFVVVLGGGHISDPTLPITS